MRTIPSIMAMCSAITLLGTDFHLVVRTTDAMVVQISVVCQGDTGLVVLNQYEERQPGSASWRGVGGVPPYRLVEENATTTGVVCFTVVDAMGKEARGCGVINELRTSRTEGCNGARSYGIGEGITGNAPLPPAQAAAVKAVPPKAEPAPEEGPRVVRGTATRVPQPGGRPPMERRDQIREVRPTPPAPRPQQQHQRVVNPVTPQPAPRRPQGY